MSKKTDMSKVVVSKLSVLLKILKLTLAGLAISFFGLSLSLAQATQRPNICEGMSTFAVQTNPNVRLAVISNPANKMISVIQCMSSEDESNYSCRTLYIGSTQDYCNAEVRARQSRLQSAGFLRVANSAFSLTTSGAGFINQLRSANGLRVNINSLSSKKTIGACHDLNLLLRIARGESWQNAVANMTPEHTALLAASDVGQSIPIIGSIASTLTYMMPASQRNSGLLANSISGVGNSDARNFNRALRTIGDSSRNFTTELNPRGQSDICSALSGAPRSQPASSSPERNSNSRTNFGVE